MKLITLSHNQFSKVDDADFEWLSKWNWEYSKKKSENTGYVRRRPMKKGKRISILMHREILGLKKGEICDHIDGDGLNNQRENLRKCTVSQNAMNKTKARIGRSGYKGAYWHKYHKKWFSQIRVNGRAVHIGWFKTDKDAAIAYNTEAKRVYGEYARINVL